MAYLDDSRRLLASLLRQHLPQVRYRPPDGTYLAWLDCTAMDLPGSPGALVTERAQVTVIDGPAFGDGGPGAFRLNFATPQPILTEMVERVDKIVGGLSVAKPVISTFHAFCVRVLRRDIEALRIPSRVPGTPPLGLTKSFVIYDEADQQQLVKSVMRRLGIDDKQVTPRSVLAHISWATNYMLDPQEVYMQ